ncbi:hypothetical protein M0812_20959 [Anaeramoeba flamelloides]|uniref:Uncharacterized protein n=1 Tax=Anaeramoeba flamelloides TaxID=1746091 RepID=A0AAV7YRA7_9EUKA|nr:hypothetical protein M0812_20959 [Anaeramoeba flamelloides]
MNRRFPRTNKNQNSQGKKNAFEQKKRVYQKKTINLTGISQKNPSSKNNLDFKIKSLKEINQEKKKKKNTVNVQNKGNKDIEIETEIGIENENENEMGKEMQSKSGFEEKYYSTLNAESAQGSGSGSEHQPDPDVRFLGKSSGFNQQRGKLSERKTRTIPKPSTIAQHSSLKKIKKAQQKSGTNSINKFEGRTEFELFPTENNQRLLLTDTQEVLDFIFGDLQKLHKRDYQETTQEHKQTMLKKKKKIVQRNLRITSLDLKLPRNKKSFEINNRLKYSQESLDFLDAYINRSKKFLNKFCKNRSMKVDIEAKNW